MKLILVAVLVVAGVSVAVAQDEEYKCETPKEWYSHFIEYDSSRQQERIGRIYYDEAQERVAIRDEYYDETAQGVVEERHIYLHQTNEGYSIRNDTRMCQKFPLTRPFPIIGPYLSDKNDGEAYIGSSAQPKDGVRVIMYSGTNDRGKFFGVWIPVDENTCLPVSETFIEQESHSTRRYYDIRQGILEPSVFDPPEDCS